MNPADLARILRSVPALKAPRGRRRLTTNVTPLYIRFPVSDPDRRKRWQAAAKVARMPLREFAIAAIDHAVAALLAEEGQE